MSSVCSFVRSVSDSLGCVVAAPIHVLTSFESGLAAHVPEAGHLEGDEQKAAVEEKEVTLPQAGVVESLEVDGLGDWPDSCSSHCC